MKFFPVGLALTSAVRQTKLSPEPSALVGAPAFSFLEGNDGGPVFDVYDYMKMTQEQKERPDQKSKGDCRKLGAKVLREGEGCWLAHAALNFVAHHEMPSWQDDWQKDPCVYFQVKEKGCDAPASFLAAGEEAKSYLWMESAPHRKDLVVEGNIRARFSTAGKLTSEAHDERDIRAEVQQFADEYRSENGGVKTVRISYCQAEKKIKPDASDNGAENAPFTKQRTVHWKLPQCSDLVQESCYEKPGNWYYQQGRADGETAPWALCYGSCQAYKDLKSFALGKSPELPQSTCGFPNKIAGTENDVDFVRQNDPKLEKATLNPEHGISPDAVYNYDETSKFKSRCGWGNRIKNWFDKARTEKKVQALCGLRPKGTTAHGVKQSAMAQEQATATTAAKEEPAAKDKEDAAADKQSANKAPTRGGPKTAAKGTAGATGGEPGEDGAEEKGKDKAAAVVTAAGVALALCLVQL